MKKKWKKKKEKIDELKTWKDGSFQKKKGVELKTWKGGSINQNLDELKIRKGDSVWKRMIGLKWVETWSGELKWEIEKEKLESKLEESCWHAVLQDKWRAEAWVSSERLKTSIKGSIEWHFGSLWLTIVNMFIVGSLSFLYNCWALCFNE